MKRILCIWLPNWPVQRIVAAQPAHKHHSRLPSSRSPSPSLVLHARHPRRGQEVVACDAFARRRGIDPGMSLAEVATLTHVSPSALIAGGSPESTILLREHNPREDLQALAQLAVWCAQFSPCVGIESGTAPSSLLLDISHSAARWGGEAPLLQAVARAFYYEREYEVVLAIADTVGAAWGVAHFATNDFAPDDFATTDVAIDALAPARESCLTHGYGQNNVVRAMPWDAGECDVDVSRSHHNSLSHHRPPCPRGYLVVVGQSSAALQPLPIDSLRLEEKTLATLSQLGVRTVGQLWQLPRSGLQARFDDSLLLRVDQALGNVVETFESYQATEPLQAKIVLEHATDDRRVLEECLAQLLHPICETLQATQRGAVQIEYRLSILDGSSITISLGLFQPTLEPQHLERLFRMRLDQQVVPDAVCRVEMEVTTSAKLEYRQHCLLGESSREAPRQLAYLIDRLSGRLGTDTVLGARVMAEPQIEYAFRYAPLTGQAASVPRSSAAATRRHQHGPGMRPLHLIRPQRLHVQDRPTRSPSHQPPREFGYQGHRYRVHRYWGPERIESGWWQGEMVRRDYYRVDDARGHRFWLFQDLSNHEWFLHGFF